MAVDSERLLVPRGDAESNILIRVQMGESLIARPIVTDGDYSNASAEYLRWIQECETLLQSILVSNEIERFHSYGNGARNAGPLNLYATTPQRTQRLRHDIQSSLNILQDVLLRVPLLPAPVRPLDVSVFVIHGHDEAAKHEVARFIARLGMKPIVLNEQPNKGQTLVEKLEASRDVSLAVALLTPDDVGRRAVPEAELRPRARQNVILELGYFTGVLGRQKVVALHKGRIELPSDYHGVVFIEMDGSGGWKLKLAQECYAAGVLVDLNLALV